MIGGIDSTQRFELDTVKCIQQARIYSIVYTVNPLKQHKET